MEQQGINIKFKNYEEVAAYSAQHSKTLLILDDYILDTTSFAEHHPGGGVLLQRNNLKDIDQQMKFHHPLTLIMANSMVIGTFKKEIARIIDPEKALLPQIWDLDHDAYMKVINSPHWLFVPSPRMFQLAFFESFSHNKWYHILVLPWLLIAYMMYSIVNWQTFNVLFTLIATVSGFFLFTLIEYFLHRWVFHSESYLPNNKIMRYLHFIMHGIHHMLPNDPDRLVYPPILAVFTFLVGQQTLLKVIQFEDPIIFAFFWTGFLIGYMTYDITHYSLHHVDTSKHTAGYFHSLQKYHNQHHYGGEEAGFGVSSPFWDVIFRTGYKKIKKAD